MTKADEIRALFDDGTVETYPCTVELAGLTEDLIDGMVSGIDFRVEVIWEETTEALLRLTFEDQSQLFLSVYGPELDAYTVHVVSDPQKWLTDQILSLKSEIEVREVSRLKAELALAHLQGKVIQMTETSDEGTSVRYLTEPEFLAEYRQYYAGHVTWGEENPTAGEYLEAVRQGEADGVENKWHTKMTAEWIGEE